MQQVLEKSELRPGGPDRERLFDAGGAHSLDDVVRRLSQSLAVRGNAACLVCGASFVRTAVTPERPIDSADCSKLR